MCLRAFARLSNSGAVRCRVMKGDIGRAGAGTNSSRGITPHTSAPQRPPPAAPLRPHGARCNHRPPACPLPRFAPQRRAAAVAMGGQLRDRLAGMPVVTLYHYPCNDGGGLPDRVCPAAAAPCSGSTPTQTVPSPPPPLPRRLCGAGEPPVPQAAGPALSHGALARRSGPIRGGTAAAGPWVGRPPPHRPSVAPPPPPCVASTGRHPGRPCTLC